MAVGQKWGSPKWTPGKWKERLKPRSPSSFMLSHTQVRRQREGAYRSELPIRVLSGHVSCLGFVWTAVRAEGEVIYLVWGFPEPGGSKVNIGRGYGLVQAKHCRFQFFPLIFPNW